MYNSSMELLRGHKVLESNFSHISFDSKSMLDFYFYKLALGIQIFERKTIVDAQMEY